MLEPSPLQKPPTPEIQKEIERLKVEAKRMIAEDAVGEAEDRERDGKIDALIRQKDALQAQIDVINNKLGDLGYFEGD